MKISWSTLAWLALSTLAVLVGIDVVANRLAPPAHLREVEDGIADLAAGNPDVLVLGSSHARTFHVLGQELQQRTGGSRTLVAVPLENGKIVPYEWTYENRIEPLLDRRKPDGTPVHDRLRELIMIIEWWDTCPNGTGVYWNLPARSWTFANFVDDFAENGLTAYNRNYLQNRVRRALGFSALYQDRTQGALVPALLDEARTLAGGDGADGGYATKIAVWHRLVEDGAKCILDPVQVGALERIVARAQQRGLDVSIVLFPRKPDTLTDQAKRTTLATFSAWAQEFGSKHRTRIIDLTTRSPLQSEDFMADFDHVNAAGNRKFARWALDHDLAYLQVPQTALTRLGGQAE